MPKCHDRRVDAFSCHPPRKPHMSPAARLVGVGFRLWLSGRNSADVSCWDNAWQLYAGQLGEKAAQVAVTELSSWVHTVARCAAREIEVNPDTCPGFCKDECLAIAMIAACQHKTCPAMRVCAFALIENPSVQAVVDQSERFAMTLVAVDQVLSPNYIVNAAALSDPPKASYVH